MLKLGEHRPHASLLHKLKFGIMQTVLATGRRPNVPVSADSEDDPEEIEHRPCPFCTIR